MKIVNKLFLLALVAVLATACSKDDEPSPDQQLEQAALAFDQENPPIEIPSSIASSNSEEAKAINSFMEQVNTLTNHSYYFEVPEGAEKSTKPINTNGRTSATKENVIVYTWTSSDGQGNSITVAYQISEDDLFYYFEYFMNYNDDGFISVVKGAESKSDLMEGYLEIFSNANNDGSSALRYQWKESADGSFTFDYFIFDSKLSLVVNADGSGTLQSFSGDDNGGYVIEVEYTWNAEGTAGTFTLYDQGEVSTTGDWTS
ncbi:hypothetical protein E1176_06100 [Fulvivirga sp. RKSG066]|uniref:hypothetical protein n=1 Tax=Fulvivirga aurantia TaxID=2529383 RepID=UPI0012BD4C41|nr:hypothetical protein [Fulvivirga aurantia]MTI20586.1 hypothetical protein [Fulvivirga aurantia]